MSFDTIEDDRQARTADMTDPISEFYTRHPGTSDQEIGELVATLGSLPPHHPLVTLLRGSHDAGSADALADVTESRQLATGRPGEIRVE